jgi:hypothetical protein
MHSLEEVDASGLGSDAICVVLEKMFERICAEMADSHFTGTWHKRSDPFSERPISAEASRFVVEELVPWSSKKS